MNTEINISISPGAIDVNAVPRVDLELLARPILCAVEKYFRRPGTVDDFRKWEKEYDRRKKQSEKI